MISHPAGVTAEEQPQPPAHRSVFRRGVLFNGGGSLLNIIFLFLETIVAVRLLSPESYGIYVLLVVVVNFLVTAVDFGCKTAVTKFIAGSDHSHQAALAHSTLVFRLMVLVLASVLIWVARDILLFLDPSGEVVHYAAYIPVMVAVASLDELFQAALQGFQLFQPMALAQIGRSVLRLCLSSLLVDHLLRDVHRVPVFCFADFEAHPLAALAAGTGAALWFPAAVEPPALVRVQPH
jgi:O-antigen/teichoic acid export membrane protein